MSRSKIPQLTDDRKNKLDAGYVQLPNTQDAAHILRIERKTLRDWVRQNRYNIASIAMRIGSDWIFEYEELLNWMRTLKKNKQQSNKLLTT